MAMKSNMVAINHYIEECQIKKEESILRTIKSMKFIIGLNQQVHRKMLIQQNFLDKTLG